MDSHSNYSTDTDYQNYMSCHETFEIDAHDDQDYCPDCNNIIDEHYEQEFHNHILSEVHNEILKTIKLKLIVDLLHTDIIGLVGAFF
jgi:hypothetical protein